MILFPSRSYLCYILVQPLMHSQNAMYAEHAATAVLTDVASACLRVHAQRGGPWEFVMGLMACDISFFMLLRSCFSRMTQDLMAPPAFFISPANECFPYRRGWTTQAEGRYLTWTISARVSFTSCLKDCYHAKPQDDER